MTDCTYCCRWIEDYLSPVDPEHHPILRMMTPIADIDCNFAEFGIEYRMTGISFHVICGFVEAADTWNVILAMLAQIFTIICNNHCRVPNCVAVSRISFQNWRHDYHIVRTS